MDAVQRPNVGGDLSPDRFIRYGPIPRRNARANTNLLNACIQRVKTPNGMAVLSWWSDLSG